MRRYEYRERKTPSKNILEFIQHFSSRSHHELVFGPPCIVCRQNIIGASKIQNNYDAIKLCLFNIVIASFLDYSLYKYHSLTILFNCRSFSLLEAIAKRFPLLFAIAFNYCCCNSLKSHAYVGSNKEKKPWTNQHNRHTKKSSKVIKNKTLAIVNFEES